MPNCKYTVEMLRPIVASSRSYAEVLRQLGLKQTGGSQSNIKRLAHRQKRRRLAVKKKWLLF